MDIHFSKSFEGSKPATPKRATENPPPAPQTNAPSPSPAPQQQQRQQVPPSPAPVEVVIKQTQAPIPPTESKTRSASTSPVPRRKLGFIDTIVTSIDKLSKLFEDAPETVNEGKQNAVDRQSNIAQDVADYKEHVIENGCSSPAMETILTRTSLRVCETFLSNRDKFAEIAKQMFLSGKLNTEEFDAKLLYQQQKLRRQAAFRKFYVKLSGHLNQSRPNEGHEVIRKRVAETCDAFRTCVEIFVDDNKSVAFDSTSLQKLEALNAKEDYRIVVSGLEKAGKSSFSNFLIGADLLPNFGQRCTMVPTWIKTGTELSVEIVFYSKEEFLRIAKISLGATLFPNQDPDPKVIETELQKLLDNFPKQSTVLLRGDLAKVKEDLLQHVSSKFKTHHYVKYVTVYTPKLAFPLPVTILDIPGFDSVIPEHREMAIEAIGQCDAFIFVTNGFTPNITKPAQENLLQLKTTGGLSFSEKGFALVTKLDRCDYLDKATSNSKVVKQDLEQYGFKSENIFFGCIPLDHGLVHGTQNLGAEEAKVFKEYQDIVAKYTFLKGGVSKLRDTLFQFINESLPFSRVKTAKEIILPWIPRFEHFLRQIPIVNFEEESEQDMERAVAIAKEQEWFTLWDEMWETTEEEAHYLRNKTFIIGKKKILSEISHMFLTEFGEFFENDSDNLSLEKEVPKTPMLYDVPNVGKIDYLKREKVFAEHDANACKAAHKVGDLVYMKLYDYVHQLKSRISADLPFDLDEVYTRVALQNQVESVVMRVAFPLGTGILLFPHDSPERKSAQRVLQQALPEIELRNKQAEYQA